MHNPQQLASIIKTTAKSKKIPLTELLTECNLSKNTLSSMTAGGYYPRLDAICKIADYLDCSIDYLLGRTGNAASHRIKAEDCFSVAAESKYSAHSSIDDLSHS